MPAQQLTIIYCHFALFNWFSHNLQLASTGFTARKLNPYEPEAKLGYRPVNHFSDLCFDQNLIRLITLAAPLSKGRFYCVTAGYPALPCQNPVTVV